MGRRSSRSELDVALPGFNVPIVEPERKSRGKKKNIARNHWTPLPENEAERIRNITTWAQSIMKDSPRRDEFVGLIDQLMIK